MSSLRELLNPQNPKEGSLQSTQNGGLNYVPGSDKQISPTTNGFNPAFSDGLSYDVDLSLKSSSSPSSASAQTADDLKPFFATGDTRHPYHKNCPDSLDCLPDTSDRPQHTLPVILRCAILGSAKGKLTIRDIYAAMENKYPYYRTAGPAWKQSVRHHLSLSTLFERKAKPVTEPGFGSYWTVNLDAPPGTKRPRKRGRHKKSTVINIPASPTSAESCNTTGRKGRPKKNAPQDFEFEPTIGMPSTTALRVPPGDCAALPTHTGNFTTFRVSTNEVSSNQYRLHSVHDLPSPNFDQDDDDEMFDSQDHCAEGGSLILSEDAGDSIDERSRVHAVYTYSGDPNTLPPPSLSHMPVDPGLVSSYTGSSEHILRLQEEVKGLQRHSALLSAAKARIADDLSDALAEIARLRARNELLEHRSGANCVCKTA